jgi:CRISPR-associated protein Csm3
MMNMKLSKIKNITGKIVLKSGLHIGSGDTEMRIGGTDKPVIKHPYTLEPYIPGSSLKGKVRSLLELRSGLIGRRKNRNVNPLGLKDLEGLDEPERSECLAILQLFGMSGADTDDKGEVGPSRASFADCMLDDEWKKSGTIQNHGFTEVKSENSIDRIDGTAFNPRFIERVPADTVFSFNIALKEFEEDQNLEAFLFEGLKLLQMDALGGSGSRGYGRVVFVFDKEEDKKAFESATPL